MTGDRPFMLFWRLGVAAGSVVLDELYTRPLDHDLHHEHNLGVATRTR